jgi:hypothetical protein
MSYPQNARVPVQDKYWIQGCNTLNFPTDLPQGQYYWAENLVNRAGVMQTRPGRNRVFSLPGNRAQGLALYRPYREKEQLVWGIDGKIFYSQYPFTSYSHLKQVRFYKNSPKVYFCQARQGAQLNLDGSITLLQTPVDILFMQDGFTASAFYIATSSTTPQQAGHNKPLAPWLQCPTGTIMFYSGNRLWVAYNETIFASDLDNPNSFAERTYLAEADGFKLPEPCTGMIETASGPTALPALLAFSPFTITSLQSNILDRTQWQNTPIFQSIISKDYGNVAPFSTISQFGLPWFYSEVGLLSLDVALNQYGSSTVLPRDMEMLRSKDNISAFNAKNICAVAFENFILVSVPSGSRFNKQTWVLDGAPQATLNGGAARCWTGIWTGDYPVQYAAGEIQDVPRAFHIGYSCEPIPDAAGNPCQIHIWEDFIGRRTDQIDRKDTPIFCSWETKIFEVSAVGELIRFKYVEIDICELLGTVELQIYYAGIKAHYRLAYSMILNAEEGLPGCAQFPSWTYQGNSATDTIFESFRPQTRTVRTPDFGGAAAEDDDCADTCGIESTYQHNVDKGFQLLFNWQGRMAIREMRLFVENYPQPGVGKCTPTEAGEVNIVSAVGCLPSPIVCQIPVP